ncbi:DUF581 domain-containing protein [Cephalotus follicularis]|uniref:DUF581 domain-containing protein n=1 Tax=Cephalotus follicularis TaxID=3775 RepID=A0A1Q3CBC6_CEPFO|nr:DUF581 domain-containing protein [Cephalotus follicularis]
MDFTTSTTTRRPCFVRENNGLASLADMEAGFSGNNNSNGDKGFYSRAFCSMKRSSSLRNPASVSSPRSARFYDARYEDHQTHFLESCFLCKKPLGGNRDIFMYRGDTPFCSEECRQEQIDIDEAKESNWNLSSSMKALRKRNDKSKSTSPSKNQDYPFRTGTVVAA